MSSILLLESFLSISWCWTSSWSMRFRTIMPANLKSIESETNSGWMMVRDEGSWAGYDEYSLLDLYSGFFWLLVLYSENLLLDRVASSSKKAQIFQNIQFLDTDISFWFTGFSWSCIFASLLFVPTWQAVVFCENANISDRPCPPCWGFQERYIDINI